MEFDLLRNAAQETPPAERVDMKMYPHTCQKMLPDPVGV